MESTDANGVEESLDLLPRAIFKIQIRVKVWIYGKGLED